MPTATATGTTINTVKTVEELSKVVILKLLVDVAVFPAMTVAKIVKLCAPLDKPVNVSARV
jgi:hypothetical protein